MKFIIRKSSFVDLLSKFCNCVLLNNKNPILSNLAFIIKTNYLLLIVTNLEIEINYKLYLSENDIIRKGSFTVNLKKLNDICKTFDKNSDILFDYINNKVYINCLFSNLSLNTLVLKDFPVLSKKNFLFSYGFNIKSFFMKDVISWTYFSIGDNDIYRHLNGMLIEYKNGFLNFVTTDGYRISICKMKIKYDLSFKDSFYIILSKKLVLELFKLIEFYIYDKEINFILNKNFIKIILGDFIIYTQILDGFFPDYEKFFLNDGYFYIDLNINDFKNSLYRSIVVSGGSLNYVTLEVKNDILKIKACDGVNDEMEDIVNISDKRMCINISLNAKFIIDVLNVIKNVDKVRIFLKDCDSMIKICNLDNELITYMIMPIKL